MNTSPPCFRFAATCVAGLCLIGCSLLKPSGVTPRTFVLTPISARPASVPAESTKIILGIKPVKMAGYLSTKSFAMRKRPNEIVYLDSVEWAERLDGAVQRVLATDLGVLIPTDQVRLSFWGPNAVTVEIEVNVEQFDVDSRGEGVLTAWWRVLSPGGEKVIASGRFSATRKGPPPNVDPQGTAASMSGLAADLAEKLVQVIRRPVA
jgi:uncharacterized lipoprotein YmbA